MDSSHKNNECYFKGLITMMEHLSEPWGIKDPQSRHLYMNRAAYLYTDTPLNFDVAGKFDHQFPADWAECAADFIEHDKMTEVSRDRVTVIETHYWYGKDSLTPFISEKLPVYNDDKQVIGVIWNAKPMNSLSPLKYINQQKPSVLTTEVNNELFTRAELDVIFLMLQRFTVKEIAKIYNVSNKTIENRIYTQVTSRCRTVALKQVTPTVILGLGPCNLRYHGYITSIKKPMSTRSSNLKSFANTPTWTIIFPIA